ncbi:MAG: S41 family peptidase, partial [Bacteroidia bacterium]
YMYNNFFYSYYPNDTLATVNWKQFNCGVGYVNMGVLQQADVNAMYSTLHNSSAIIFDLRNYPNGTAWAIANKLYPHQKAFSKLSIPDVTYPGTYYWTYDYIGVNGNPTPYNGKIIILMNEQTQSQAEFSCMIIGNMPNAVKVGSQTAGTDGNTSYFSLSTDIQTGFTSMGVYYPNGDSTERIGIKPDSLVYPTPMGIRHHRDEVLEKALQIANCSYVSIPTVVDPNSSIQVYPNPTKGSFVIQTNSVDKQVIQVVDISGKIVLSQTVNGTTIIDAGNLNAGVYNICINSSVGVINKKLVVVK